MKEDGFGNKILCVFMVVLNYYKEYFDNIRSEGFG